MKALFSSQFTSTRTILLLSLTVLLGSWLSACDFNVEITDEKRSLEKIGGTPPCGPGVRFSTGTSGTQTVRLFLVDDRSTPEALDLDGINKEPYNLKIDSFTIGEAAIKVVDASDGSEATGVKATLQLVTSGDEPLVVQPNPRYDSLKKTIGNKRVPKAVSLLIDMSETASNEDSSTTRTGAATQWTLENFNEDTTQGDVDIFSTMVVKDGSVSAENILFKTWDSELQYISPDGRRRGFVYTSKDSKDAVSRALGALTNNDVGGKPPAFRALEAAILDTRAVSRDSETQEAIHNPGVIFVSLEQDKETNNVARAVKAAKGDAWDGNDDKLADFVPVMSIVYPLPQNATPTPKVAEWDKYIDNLCKVSTASGVSNRVYWGQVFQIPASVNPRTTYQSDLRSHLDMAYHALKGYLGIKVKYSLSGTQPGKRYLVSFKLQATLLEQKSNLDDSPYITFEVRTK